MVASETVGSYSSIVGFIYVFNLIVGTGALTMPKAFANAGWILSLAILCLLAFISYLTVTFVIEAMSIGNAMKRLKQTETTINDPIDTIDAETTPLLRHVVDSEEDESLRSVSVFTIVHQLELANLAHMLFSKIGIILFYASLCIYLYGDLTIYSAAVPKSVRDVACTYEPPPSPPTPTPPTTRTPPFTPIPTPQPNDTKNADYEYETLEMFTFQPIHPANNSLAKNLCWEGIDLSRDDVYRIFVTIFFALLGPFVFFNVSKTKYIQILTTLMRWAAFSIMLVLTIIRLAKGQGRGHPPEANFKEAPNFFGVCVYAFMCHHSLPALITPIRTKRRVSIMLCTNFVIILLFYIALSMTEIFSFATLDDLATLNFQPNHPNPITSIAFFQYFLALFPAFTLSTNFPIIGITLRNNLRELCKPLTANLHPLINRLIFPIGVLLPPFAISLATDNVSMLVSITGGYAGVAIQYIIPAALVFCGRRAIFSVIPQNIQFDTRFKQIHRSFFCHWIWPVAVFVWSGLVYITVTYTFFAKLH